MIYFSRFCAHIASFTYEYRVGEAGLSSKSRKSSTIGFGHMSVDEHKDSQ